MQIVTFIPCQRRTLSNVVKRASCQIKFSHIKAVVVMQSLQNAYLCDNLVRTGARALRTGLAGPDMPKDLHPMIWGRMKEEMLEILMWARINKEKRQRD
jgi:hypothetical protein